MAAVAEGGWGASSNLRGGRAVGPGLLAGALVGSAATAGPRPENSAGSSPLGPLPRAALALGEAPVRTAQELRRYAVRSDRAPVIARPATEGTGSGRTRTSSSVAPVRRSTGSGATGSSAPERVSPASTSRIGAVTVPPASTRPAVTTSTAAAATARSGSSGSPAPGTTGQQSGADPFTGGGSPSSTIRRKWLHHTDLADVFGAGAGPVVRRTQTGSAPVLGGHRRRSDSTDGAPRMVAAPNPTDQITPATGLVMGGHRVAPPRGTPGPAPAVPGSAAPAAAGNRAAGRRARSATAPNRPGTLAPEGVPGAPPVPAGLSPVRGGPPVPASAQSLVDSYPATLFDRMRAPASSGQQDAAGPATGGGTVDAASSALVTRRSSMSQPVPGGRAADSSAGIVDALTSREWDQLVDLVVERIEDRIDEELARRGRRSGSRLY